MATFKYILFLFFTSFCGFSQERTIEVYNYVDGFREISPSKIIKIKIDKIEIYDVTNSIKEITPTKIIIDNNIPAQNK